MKFPNLSNLPSVNVINGLRNLIPISVAIFTITASYIAIIDSNFRNNYSNLVAQVITGTFALISPRQTDEDKKTRTATRKLPEATPPQEPSS